ncbi:hypothetical protein [Pseudanabaena mucicola]|uniref:F5/8 type C domain-containing protein n=1 Tax=Pseudanabaena mucicola FACHB-723 TaxID=2692860 RepID=A0ABR8A270_9CYAN|nr:hypothetical protein [Pseudanabaena mucicola]MBD2189860.1 hypothetical protein [Pseudanabaena mucicola FACHB-723]
MALTWQQIHKDVHLHEDGAINITEPFTGNLISVSLDILEYPDNRQILGYLIQFTGIAEKRYPLFSAKEVLFFVIPQTDSLKFIPTAYLQEIYELEINVSNVELSDDGVVTAATTIADIVGLQTALNGKASVLHAHTIADITGLQTKLDALDTVDESKANSADLAVLNTNVTGLATSVTNLTSQVNDLANQVDSIPDTSGDTALTVVTSSQTLEVNKAYFVNTASLILTLPNNPVMGDYVRMYNGNFDTRVNHGNASQKIKNGTTDTSIGINNGIILKPYSLIELVFVGSDLWLSAIKIREVYNGINGLTSLANLSYSSNGDTNGLVYWLGTDGLTTTFSNPQTSKITGLQSSIFNGVNSLVSRLTDRNTSGEFHSNNEANAWFGFDLGATRRIRVDRYVLQSRSATNDRHLRSWVLEGTNTVSANTVSGFNAATWTAIHSQTNNGWATNVNVFANFAVSSVDSYRYLRVRQTGANSGSGDLFLTLGEIEFYGELFATYT